MKMNYFFLLFFSATCITTVSFSQQVKTERTEEEQGVLDVVNLFFQSMTERDTVAAKSILTEDGQYYAMRNDENGIFQRTISHTNYIHRLAAGVDLVQERIWNPTIKVHKLIAMVWAPYDIHVNGKFLHCGVDSFSLIKTEEGWKIAGTIFTMEPEGCEKSPLGPLKQ